MKKLTLFFFALLAVCLAFQACDNSKTYAEMLEEEKDAIKAFIKDSSIVVISQSEFYAQDSTTDVSRNEYVQLASGVYMQIVDKGSTNPADTVKPNDLILVRFEEQGLIAVGGVIFSCFLREDTEKPMIKISLRSVGTFPCNQLAAEFFGGGGHLNASGGEFYGTMDEARKVFEQALEKYKPLLNAKG